MKKEYDISDKAISELKDKLSIHYNYIMLTTTKLFSKETIRIVFTDKQAEKIRDILIKHYPVKKKVR